MFLIAYTGDGKISFQNTVERETVNSSRYCEFVQYTCDKFRRERQGSLRVTEVIWQHDNTRPHVSHESANFMNKKGDKISKTGTLFSGLKWM